MSDAAPPDPPTRPLGRQVRLGVAAVVVLGLSGGLLLVGRALAPVGVVHGKVIGPATQVILQDIPQGILRPGRLEPDGQFTLSIPPQAKQPTVLIHGEGETLVESAPLTVQERVDLPPLALWSTPLRIRVERGSAHFDWSPIPRGAGFPTKKVTYSLLVKYVKKGGEEAETSFRTPEPRLKVDLRELTGLMREWNPANRDLKLELRAWEQAGPLWVGVGQSWTIP